MKRKPGGKDRHDLSRTHASPQLETTGTASSMSGRIDRARPDLQPPALCCPRSRHGLAIFRNWRFGEAVHERCHVTRDVAIHSEDVGQVESAEAVGISTGQDEARSAPRLAGIDHGDAESLERRARCHPWCRSPWLHDRIVRRGRLHWSRASSRLEGSPLRRQYAAMAASWRASLRHSASISGWRSAVIAARCERYRSRKALGSGALPRR